MIRLVLIGTGKVAQRLYDLWKNNEVVSVVQVVGRNKIRLSRFGGTATESSISNLVEDADIYLLAVPDAAIEEVSRQVTGTGKFIVHTSGTAGIDHLSEKHRPGVFYPIQTFSRDRPPDLKTVPICIEATRAADLQLLKQLGNTLSERVQEVTSENRKVIHLAAVFANNFTNHLYHISQELMDSLPMPREILQPLIEETASKLREISALDAQTGPALRNDELTIDQHLRILKNPGHRDIYKLLSNSIRNTHVEKL